MKRWTKIAIGVGAALSLSLAAGYAGARPYGYGAGCGFGGGPGYGMGYGGGPGYGMGFGGGPGYGMGPGRMGGYGPGYGMGPGHMGGYGPGGYGYGYGGISDLTSEQREKLAAIQEEFRGKQWKLMESMHGLAWNQRGAYRDGKFDEKAAREANEAVSAIRKQMFENSLEAQKRVEGVLTAKQREEWRGGRE